MTTETIAAIPENYAQETHRLLIPQEIAKLIGAIIPKDTSRPALCNRLLIDSDAQGNTRIVVTDTYRLCFVTFHGAQHWLSECVLPELPGLYEIRSSKIAVKKLSSSFACFGDNKKMQEYELRLDTENRYPNVNRMLPDEKRHKIVPIGSYMRRSMPDGTRLSVNQDFSVGIENLPCAMQDFTISQMRSVNNPDCILHPYVFDHNIETVRYIVMPRENAKMWPGGHSPIRRAS